MSFVNWSLFFSYSSASSLVEALLKKDSVLTYTALSTVVLLINVRAVIYAATALLRHRHRCVEVAERSNSTLHLFANHSPTSLNKSFSPFQIASEIPCSDNIMCRCWFYMYTVPTGTYKERFSPRTLPYPCCHLHPSDGRDAPAQWVTLRDLFSE